jgi:hypothetical protein
MSVESPAAWYSGGRFLVTLATWRVPSMAKRKAAPMQATSAPKRKRTGKAVRLDLTPKDHKRLESVATTKGLTLASCARMAVLDWLKAMESDQ